MVLSGLPYCRMSAVVGAVVLAATDPDPSTNGSVYTIPDDKEVFRIDQKDVDLFNAGLYKQLVDRVSSIKYVSLLFITSF
jgi:hypothetical protein